jgi:hypothetical protein
MLLGRSYALVLPLIALVGACGSSEDGSGGDGGSGNADGGPVLVTDGGGNTGYEGGTRPLPDGGLAALRDASCAGWSASPEPLPAVLMLVVDVSNSMNDIAPGSQESKWVVTRDALQQAIDALPATTAVGVIEFPNQDTGIRTLPAAITECVDTSGLIPAQVLGRAGSTQRTALQQSLLGVTVTAGTPTYDAYTYALQQFQTSTLSGNKYLLLITDGLPTYGEQCVGTGRAQDAIDAYITSVQDAIGAASAAGTRTFIIGSPGSEETNNGSDARPWLSRAAQLGGTALPGCANTGPDYCHFDMVSEPDFAAGLTTALRTIAGQITQCEYTLPQPPSGQTLSPDEVNVVYTQGDSTQLLVLRSSDADCEEGWTYSADGLEVVLCSQTCHQVQNDPGARLELMFGCASELLPPT